MCAYFSNIIRKLKSLFQLEWSIWFRNNIPWKQLLYTISLNWIEKHTFPLKVNIFHVRTKNRNTKNIVHTIHTHTSRTPRTWWRRKENEAKNNKNSMKWRLLNKRGTLKIPPIYSGLMYFYEISTKIFFWTTATKKKNFHSLLSATKKMFLFE